MEVSGEKTEIFLQRESAERNTWSHEPVQVFHLWKAAPAGRQNEDQTKL